MGYERIHRVQTGIISPTKLTMKLTGPHHKRKKDGSNINSARTSPSKPEDTEFVKNSLLTSKSGDSGEEVAAPRLEVVHVPGGPALEANHGDKIVSHPKENGEIGGVKGQQFSKAESGNSSAVHPVRALEDENIDYDSNASSSSFEFHKERSAHGQFTRSFLRPVPSKWNDAEKWIMNRQNLQHNSSKKNALHNQGNQIPVANMVRTSPDLLNRDPKTSVGRVADTKGVDVCLPASQTALEKFSFIPSGIHPISGQSCSGSALLEQCTESKDLKEVNQTSCTKTVDEDATVVPIIRSVCMRDMGTEMTPVPSQEPSRTATPVGATTPLRSPNSSVPSTPRRGAPAPTPTPTEQGTYEDLQCTNEYGKRELTEQELKLKTRREIVALGVQLGKMNIAAWASKGDQEKKVETTNIEELEQVQFEKRAAVWEEFEKSKHLARYKREEIKIQAWESQQRAKLEAEMRRIEAQVEQMRAQAHAKMAKNIAVTRQKSEEKLAAAEARKNRDAERTAAQAEYIRQTGRMPSPHNMCCGWLT